MKALDIHSKDVSRFIHRPNFIGLAVLKLKEIQAEVFKAMLLEKIQFSFRIIISSWKCNLKQFLNVAFANTSPAKRLAYSFYNVLQ